MLIHLLVIFNLLKQQSSMAYSAHLYLSVHSYSSCCECWILIVQRFSHLWRIVLPSHPNCLIGEISPNPHISVQKTAFSLQRNNSVLPQQVQVEVGSSCGGYSPRWLPNESISLGIYLFMLSFPILNLGQPNRMYNQQNRMLPIECGKSDTVVL